ncbi:MAG: GNAT family N-acetyltransferase [Deltaproteobacteria bacterium]|nr:GNAT family N-acetyltransferase [Deltaproteobacteria bacterium]
MVPEEIRHQYPKTFQLTNGRPFTIRLMQPTEEDKRAILSFARTLNENDLLYLRTDITDPGVISQWIRNVETGQTTSLIAEADDQVAGYASVHNEPARWTRCVGELRVNAGQRFRGAGLGRALVAEAFSLGQALGLRKLYGMLTPDQHGARTAFERLGFRVEAALHEWVQDRGGRLRDILILTHEVDGFTDQAA